MAVLSPLVVACPINPTFIRICSAAAGYPSSSSRGLSRSSYLAFRRTHRSNVCRSGHNWGVYIYTAGSELRDGAFVLGENRLLRRYLAKEYYYV